MSKYGEPVGAGGIRFVRLLPGPIERVWDYLTVPEKRALWLAGGETAREPGGAVEFQFDNGALSPHADPIPEKYKDMEEGVTFEGRVLEYDAPRLLRISWPERDGGNTEVSFRLTEKSDKVELELVHMGIKHSDDLIGASAGWHTHFDILEDQLSSRVPGPFWAAHQTLEAAYKDRLSAEVAQLGSA